MTVPPAGAQLPCVVVAETKVTLAGKESMLFYPNAAAALPRRYGQRLLPTIRATCVFGILIVAGLLASLTFGNRGLVQWAVFAGLLGLLESVRQSIRLVDLSYVNDGNVPPRSPATARCVRT